MLTKMYPFKGSTLKLCCVFEFPHPPSCAKKKKKSDGCTKQHPFKDSISDCIFIFNAHYLPGMSGILLIIF